MNTIYLGIGTNLGNREENIIEAVDLIEKYIGSVIQSSSIYETEPWGFKSEYLFLNMVVRVETRLSPEILLRKILMIEELMGRVRDGGGYKSRVIDIDILLYDTLVIDNKILQIPHHRMTERRFVLVPLCEIADDLIHPVMGKSIRELLEECRDESKVLKY